MSYRRTASQILIWFVRREFVAGPVFFPVFPRGCLLQIATCNSSPVWMRAWQGIPPGSVIKFADEILERQWEQRPKPGELEMKVLSGALCRCLPSHGLNVAGPRQTEPGWSSVGCERVAGARWWKSVEIYEVIDWLVLAITNPSPITRGKGEKGNKECFFERVLSQFFSARSSKY